MKPHSVAVIDPKRNTIVADIPTGGYPGPLAADKTYIYVCNIGDATVSRIFADQRKLFDTSAFARATDLLAGDNGELWSANGGSPGHTPLGVGNGTVAVWYPGPTVRPFRVGPNVLGDEEQTTLAADALAVRRSGQGTRTAVRSAARPRHGAGPARDPRRHAGRPRRDRRLECR